MKIATKIKTDDGVTFKWANGHEDFVNLNKLPANIIQELALHGLSQKLGDSYAAAESVGEAQERMFAVLTNLQQGLFNGARATATGGVDVEILFDLMAGAKTMDECREAVLGWDKATKTTFNKRPDVKLAKAERKLAAEKAKASKVVDIDPDMLESALFA